MEIDLVSIITPMYKSADFITETIESVLNQTYENWEMIIVDDCSPDGGESISAVQAFTDERIKLIQLKNNCGPSAARNIALKVAKGHYIAFLDADDLWPKNYLEAQICFLKDYNAVIVYGGVQRIDEQTKEYIGRVSPRKSKVNYEDMLKFCPIAPSACVFDLQKSHKYFFNEELRSSREDYVYWLSLLKDIPFAYYNPKVIILYRVRKDSVTAFKYKIIFPHWNVLRKVEGLSFFKSTYCMLYWIFSAFVKLRIY